MYQQLFLKNFQFNIGTGYNFYELVIIDESVIDNIVSKLFYDYYGAEELAVLQIREDMTEPILFIDGNVYDLTLEEFQNILNILPYDLEE